MWCHDSLSGLYLSAFECSWNRSREAHKLAGPRVDEFQGAGMQGETPDRVACRSVFSVTGHRTSHVGAVVPYLVFAAGSAGFWISAPDLIPV